MSGRRLAPAPAPAHVPPQNLEAEESVLGAVMLSNRAIDTVSEILLPEDFYRGSHGLIYQASLALHLAGRPIDAITLTDYLEGQPQPFGDPGNALEAIGGRVRLHELAALVPATANVGHWARIVRETSILRSLIRCGGEISRLGWERPEEAHALVEKAEELIFDLAQRGQSRDLRPAATILGEVYKRIVERSERGAEYTGVPSGFRPLDDLTSGFQPGNLVIVAGRPSMGKSGLALCIIANVAIRQQIPVALFTLEMSESEVIERLLSSEAFVESQRIRNGSLAGDDWQKVTSAAGKIEGAPLFIDDSGLITMAEIRSKARRHKLRHPNLGLVVVDYLQLMTSGSSAENRVQEVSQISRGLKVLAGELGVPVLALSQLSRQVEQRHDKRPILSDLRESGSVEQDADLVAFVYRDEYYNPEDTDQQGVAEVNLAKQRNGPTGTVKLSFVKRYARFSELAIPGDLSRTT